MGKKARKKQLARHISQLQTRARRLDVAQDTLGVIRGAHDGLVAALHQLEADFDAGRLTAEQGLARVRELDEQAAAMEHSTNAIQLDVASLRDQPGIDQDMLKVSPAMALSQALMHGAVVQPLKEVPRFVARPENAGDAIRGTMGPFPYWEGAPALQIALDAGIDLLNRPRIGTVRRPRGQEVESIDVISGMDGVALQVLPVLYHAKPIYIGADQLLALPDWTVSDAYDYSHDLHLPFDTDDGGAPIMLDFTDQVGQPAQVPVHIDDDGTGHPIDALMTLYGAAIFRVGGAERALRDGGGLGISAGLTVAPFGCRLTAMGKRDVFGRPQDTRGVALPDASCLGLVSFGEATVQVRGLDDVLDPDLPAFLMGEMGLDGELPFQETVTASLRTPIRYLLNNHGFVAGSSKGHGNVEGAVFGGSMTVMKNVMGAVMRMSDDHFGDDHPNQLENAYRLPAAAWQELWDSKLGMTAVGEQAVATALAATALSALYWLDSRNVRIVEGTGTRAQRRRAERGGGRIALVVRVTNRRSKERTSSDMERAFTHRFDRSGYYRHVTRGSHLRCPECKGRGKVWEFEGTRLQPPAFVQGTPVVTLWMDGHAVHPIPCAACRATGKHPDVKPCVRRDEATGDLTCPDGCRREWVPPTVVGPDDKPYVPKTRRVA